MAADRAIGSRAGGPLISRLASLLSGAALTACSVVGIRETEEPPHRVVGHVGAVEIREYGARIAAETTVGDDEMAARSLGFRRLAGYIFGANRTRASIAMTAPVAQSQPSSQTIAMTAPVAQGRDAAESYVIRFFMPPTFTMDTLPAPNDPVVRLVAVPAETVAVLRYSGSTAPSAVATRRGELLQALTSGPWQPTGEPAAWFYDPPWTLPFLRRNEVAVAVVPR